MVWKILKAGGFEEGQKIEYYKLLKRFKLLVTHSIGGDQSLVKVMACDTRVTTVTPQFL